MKNYLTVLDFNLSGIGDSNANEITAAIELAKQISEFYPAKAFVRISEHEGKRFYEGADVFLVHPLEIRVHYNYYNKKKYHFFAWKLHSLRNVSESEKSRISRDIGEPQQIGVLTANKLTANKIQAWVNYLERVYDAAKIKNEEQQVKIKAFRDSLKDLQVRWTTENSGYIERGGLEFSFSIDSDHISTYIKIAPGAGSSLETFNKMSCNDLAAEQARNHVSGKELINH